MGKATIPRNNPSDICAVSVAFYKFRMPSFPFIGKLRLNFPKECDKMLLYQEKMLKRQVIYLLVSLMILVFRVQLKQKDTLH